ncbi:tRNA (cytosine(38)-C(5))-methyltransferase [Trichoplax sp. H2]|nr:tRNA (cytosine(38)-C(5))-methyltransferase [Trichoplax sp. H2]|eukprot:RDD45044.1 tRNA (cytosine(38)-C(5))-methyltransferase [Trichoplax sp. H2]
MSSARGQVMQVVEFYSGIGGMHYAIQESNINAKILAAIDINTVANNVYRHNFGNTPVWQREIGKISLKELQELNGDLYTMSPPCQPFTRLGKKADVNDARTSSFLHVIDLLIKMENPPKYILLENVKGFETSAARNALISALKQRNYSYQEFLLTPLQFGIPNSRLRYYIICTRDANLSFPTTEEVMMELPNFGQVSKVRCVSDFMENLTNHSIQSYFLPQSTIERFLKVLDVVKPDSQRSCCFTKSYFHYAEGTGSVLQITNPILDSNLNLKINDTSNDDNQLLQHLKLRYFTPREVANIHCFPVHFNFPENATKKQCYRLLGNSLNVHVASELLKLLIT